jgi:transposase
MAHPNKVRSFAKACGILAKTDRIDAGVLFRYGEVFVEPTAIVPTNKALKLREILRRRQQLMATRIKELNRLEKHPGEMTRRSCERHLVWLETEITELDQALKSQLDQSELQQQSDLYCSVRGVGLITAATLIAELPELGRYDSKALTALVGLAPWSRDSGKQHGYRAIRGGRSNVRKALYMAAICTIRTAGPLRSFYLRLKHRGKPGKVALVAVMRKMLLILNAIAHRGTPWVENLESA